MIRRIAAVLAASAIFLVLAVPVLAGGWADIVADAQTGKPPVEGQPTEVGFTVLQHGVTPAPWETATVHFTDSATGESFDVTATNDRDDGHFVAKATLPHAGYWSWQVTLRDLLSQQVPVRMTVLTRTGPTPPFDPATLMAAVDQAKVDVTKTVTEGVGADVERLGANAERQRATIGRLESATRQLAALRRTDRAGIDQVMDALNMLKRNPRPAGASRMGPDRMRIHVAQYRVIYRIEGSDPVIITVEHVGSRNRS